MVQNFREGATQPIKDKRNAREHGGRTAWTQDQEDIKNRVYHYRSYGNRAAMRKIRETNLGNFPL